MHDQNNTVIEHRGRLYRYDPDLDAFYPIERYRSMSAIEAWSPLLGMLVLCAVAIWAEYLR